MFRSVLLLVALALSCTEALVSAPLAAQSKLSVSRVSSIEMAPKAAKGAKAAPKKAAPKKVVAKKVVAKKVVAKKVVKKAPPKKVVRAAPSRGGSSPKGKGGIFPWVTNEPGTYAEVAMLSSFDFLGDDGDKFIGWGFMPNSVKNLYASKRRRSGY